MTPATSQRRSPPLHKPRLEKDATPDIKRAVRRVRGLLLRLHSGTVPVPRGYMRQNEGGTPDWLLMLPDGMAIFLEQKRPGGVRSAAQLAWAAKAEQMGHRVYVVESGGELIAVLDAPRLLDEPDRAALAEAIDRMKTKGTESGPAPPAHE